MHNLPLAADPYKDESVVFQSIDTVYRMNADGTGMHTSHFVVRIQSEGAARTFGVLQTAYASAVSTGSIENTRVYKPDGSVVETPASDAQETPAPVTQQAPLYSDIKVRQLPVRSLSPGDRLEYDIVLHFTSSEAPGQFWGTHPLWFPDAVVLSNNLTLQAPASKFVQVYSPHYKPEITEKDGLRTWRWHNQQLHAARATGEGDDAKPAEKNPDEDAEGRTLPSVAWTSFHSWAELGDWYRSLAAPRAQPTDALRARADEITKDSKTPEDQVRAIYEYVSSRVRYVGVDLGIGRYQPHPAADVLSNQYGDCKDKDTLLEALLRAKGFTTAPALVGAHMATTPDLPSPAFFNHVITTVELPSGRIWLDSTPEVVPFRMLTDGVRGQRALLVPEHAPAFLETAPEKPPFPFQERFVAVATLNGQGALTGHMSLTARSDDEVNIRLLARNVAPAEWDKASQYISSAKGFGGTTSHTQFAGLGDLNHAVTVTYDYTRKTYGDWDNLRIVPLFPAIGLPSFDGEKQPEDDFELGAPRTEVAVSHIHLPEGFHPDLPDPVHVKTGYATFDKTYKFADGEMVSERTVTVLQRKLSKDQWKQYKEFCKQAGIGNENWVQLIRPSTALVLKGDKVKADGKSASAGAAKQPIAESRVNANATAQEQMQQAGKEVAAGNYGTARDLLDGIKKNHPDQPNLNAAYGNLALAQRDYATARPLFEKELEKNPDNEWAVRLLAYTEHEAGDRALANHTLSSFLQNHPDEVQVRNALVRYQMQAGDFGAAANILRAAAEAHPDDRNLQAELATALLRAGRKDDAAVAAEKAIEGSDDPYLLNNASYVLSETGKDLRVAEAASRKSVGALEAKSVASSIDAVNSRAFAESNSLIASWDTLGWILFQQGKYSDAMPLILASWRNDLHAEVGDHLAQVYENLGDTKKAADQYRLAHLALDGNTAPHIRIHIETGMHRLDSHYDAAREGTAGKEQLQALRTYKVPRAAGVAGWGTFRLQITADGKAAAVQQASGDSRLKPMADTIKAVSFTGLVPAGSAAHLLRSGVLSCSSDPCELVLVPNATLQTEAEASGK